MRISEAGYIDAKGRLRLPMDRINEATSKHPGARVVVAFDIAERGGTEAQHGYYYGYVLPAVVEALKRQGTRVSEANADRWLVSLFPGEKTYDGHILVLARQLNRSQMSDFLEWLQQYAAENLDIYIEDPTLL